MPKFRLIFSYIDKNNFNGYTNNQKSSCDLYFILAGNIPWDKSMQGWGHPIKYSSQLLFFQVSDRIFFTVVTGGLIK